MNHTPCSGLSMGWPMLAMLAMLTGAAAASEHLAPDYSFVTRTMHNMSQDNKPEHVCGFCHTPVYSGNQLVPQWQTIPLDPFFTEGVAIKPGVYRTAGPASLICLFCHDKTGMLASRAAPAMDPPHPVGTPFKGVVFETNVGNLDYGVARQGTYGNGPVWWVETGTDGFQGDDVLLFPRQLADGRVVPFIECASCHDPHSPNPFFLRLTDAERLCYACHPNI